MWDKAAGCELRAMEGWGTNRVRRLTVERESCAMVGCGAQTTCAAWLRGEKRVHCLTAGRELRAALGCGRNKLAG